MDLFTIMLAILALGVLIMVHELGHYLAAKISGIYVETFSIGMGKTLFAVKRGETEYRLSAIPLGGYVKLHRMFEEEDEVEGMQQRAFYNKSAPIKLFVITAGVLFNILFAVFLIMLTSLVGKKDFTPTMVGIKEGGAASIAGIHEFDKVVQVGNTKIISYEQFANALDKQKGVGTFKVVVERGDLLVETQITPGVVMVKDPFGDEVEVMDLGMTLYAPPIISDIVANSAASRSPLQVGDKVLAINGAPITHWSAMSKIISSSADKEILFTVLRDNKEVLAPLTPEAKENDDGTMRGLAGIQSSVQGDIVVRQGLITSMSTGISQTIRSVGLIYKGLWKMVTGQVSKKDIGGPIMIVQLTASTAKAGYDSYLLFVAIISVNLAVINLLPIPILDGGYVLLYIGEAITRKKVSAAARARAQSIGITLLLLLMVFAVFNDITRIFS